MENTQAQEEQRTYPKIKWADKKPADVNWNNHSYLLHCTMKNEAVWQQDIQEARKNQMPCIVTINDNGEMHFNFMKDLNALAAMQQAKEAGYESNCWLTIDAVQNLRLKENEDSPRKVLGVTKYVRSVDENGKAEFTEDKVLLVNANNYIGSGLSKMYAKMRSALDTGFRDYQDKIAVSLLKNMAETVTAEKADEIYATNRENMKLEKAARPKFANIMSDIRVAYTSAVEEAKNMLREESRQRNEDLRKNSEEYNNRIEAIKSFNPDQSALTNDETNFMMWMKISLDTPSKSDKENRRFVLDAVTAAKENGFDDKTITDCIEKFAPEAVINKGYAGWVTQTVDKEIQKKAKDNEARDQAFAR